MNSFKTLAVLGLVACFAVCSSLADDVAVQVENSNLDQDEQACLIQAMPWMFNIPTTTNIEELFAHVKSLIHEEEATGNEVRVGEQSIETSRDCAIYTAVMQAVLLYTPCGDGRTASDVYTKLMNLPEDSDPFFMENPRFSEFFDHLIVCDAHVQTIIN